MRNAAFGKKFVGTSSRGIVESTQWTPIDCLVYPHTQVVLVPLDGDAMFIFQSFLFFGLRIKPIYTIIK